MGSGGYIKKDKHTNRAKHASNKTSAHMSLPTRKMLKDNIIPLKIEPMFYKTQYFEAGACFKKTPIANI